MKNVNRNRYLVTGGFLIHQMLMILVYEEPETRSARSNEWIILFDQVSLIRGMTDSELNVSAERGRKPRINT